MEPQQKQDVWARQKKYMRDVDLALAGEPCFLFGSSSASPLLFPSTARVPTSRRQRGSSRRRRQGSRSSRSRSSSHGSRGSRGSTASTDDGLVPISSIFPTALNVSTDSTSSSTSSSSSSTSSTKRTTTGSSPLRMSAGSRRAKKQAAANLRHKQVVAVAWYNRLRPSHYLRHHGHEEREA